MVVGCILRSASKLFPTKFPLIAPRRPEKISNFLGNLFVALFVIHLPNIVLLVLSFSYQSFMALLCFYDIVSVVFIGFLCFCSVGVDLNCVSQPARIVPPRLQEARCEWTFLEQFGFVTHIGLDAHVF